MDAIDTIFHRKSIILSKLVPYGFTYGDNSFIYKKTLRDSGFIMSVIVSETGKISAEIVDPSTDELYTLHLNDGAVGSFVGGIRMEYEETLEDIAEKCCEPDVFKSDMAKALIAYVRDVYGNELEYLWAKFPDNAVWRCADNGKWYGALLTVSKRKLGIESDEVVEIIDLRAETENLKVLLDKENYYPGWHMNKKHWYTVILDGSVPFDEICAGIDASYLLAKRSKG